MENKVIDNINSSALDSNIELIKNEKNVISSILSDMSNNELNTETNTTDEIEQKITNEINENVEENKLNNIESANIENSNTENTNVQSTNTNNDNVDTKSNCLALTIREDYHIVVVKNFFRKGARISWKVALSIITINFLNMFL